MALYLIILSMSVDTKEPRTYANVGDREADIMNSRRLLARN